MALLFHSLPQCLYFCGVTAPHTAILSELSPANDIQTQWGEKKKRQKKSSHPPGFQEADLWVVAGNKSQVPQPMKRC